MERLIEAKRWTRGQEVRFYLTTVDESGAEHHYTRYLTGNHFQAKGWGTEKLWNGVEEGKPNAQVMEQYLRLTAKGRQSYKQAPRPAYRPDEEDEDMAGQHQEARGDGRTDMEEQFGF
jgi:hypothetical protein